LQRSPNQHGDETREGALLEATRRLLWVDGPEAVRDATIEFVVAVGATISTVSQEPALPLDISFGAGRPVFPSAPTGTVARAFLEEHLPRLLMDGARAVELAARHAAIADEAAVDQVTGLPNRSAIDRTLNRLRSDDTIVMIDLEQMAADGPEGGDEILKVFGHVLRATSRGRDVVGRYSTDEFVAVLSAGGNATAFLRRLLEEWKRNRPQPISFSAGIVHPAGDRSSTLALVDQAVTLAKEGGRGRWVWIPGGAVPEELGPGPLGEV
jgi:diguanylate cyclase (GGDEF)-like protein